MPISNSRYALNAVNARYQSLYDSLYGTDVIQTEESASERYDPERGLEVIKYSKKFLDKFFTLKKKSWKDVIEIKIINKDLYLDTYKIKDQLKEPDKFIGYRGAKEKPICYNFKK